MKLDARDDAAMQFASLSLPNATRDNGLGLSCDEGKRTRRISRDGEQGSESPAKLTDDSMRRVTCATTRLTVSTEKTLRNTVSLTSRGGAGLLRRLYVSMQMEAKAMNKTEQAYLDGATAYDQGKRKDTCPYAKGALAIAWRQGWQMQRDIDCI